MASKQTSGDGKTDPVQTTVVVTGANRGIGLGLVTTLVSDKSVRVIATTRDAKKSPELQALAKANAHLSVVELDVNDMKSVSGLGARLGVDSVDVLINNAGVFTGKPTLDSDTAEEFSSAFQINVIGTWAVTNALLPLLRKAPSKRACILNLSSEMGSMHDTANGSWPPICAPYRVSKAALHELSIIQAREYNADAALPAVTVVVLSPGLVDTDMSKTVTGVPKLSANDAGRGIVKTVFALKPERKAAFINWDGTSLKW